MLRASSNKTVESSMKGSKKRKQKLRKHPLAPKKPRSAFILYSQHMHNETKMFVSNAQDCREKVRPPFCKCIVQFLVCIFHPTFSSAFFVAIPITCRYLKQQSSSQQCGKKYHQKRETSGRKRQKKIERGTTWKSSSMMVHGTLRIN